jgi:hypothetical protein
MTTPKRLPSGAVLQSAIPMRKGPAAGIHTSLVRGAVMVTYVTDDSSHPFAADNPVAVYCDVLVYTQLPGSKFYYLKNCLVAQPMGGIQRGHIWKPRASRIDTTNPAGLDQNVASNPANFDGDHVLVSFIDGKGNQPVIIGTVPHPSLDVGNAQKPIGARLKLQVADGDPSFLKHHGSYFGIDDAGEFKVDTTFANGGTTDASGNEPAPSTSGSNGNHLYNFEQHSKRLTSLMNMANPTSPSAVMTELLALASYVLDYMSQTPAWQVKAGSNNVLNLQNSGSSTTAAVGDGSCGVANGTNLAMLWGNLVTYLNAHTHPTSTGPSGLPSTMAPTYSSQSSVTSSKVTIPNG